MEDRHQLSQLNGASKFWKCPVARANGASGRCNSSPFLHERGLLPLCYGIPRGTTFRTAHWPDLAGLFEQKQLMHHTIFIHAFGLQRLQPHHSTHPGGGIQLTQTLQPALQHFPRNVTLKDTLAPTALGYSQLIKHPLHFIRDVQRAADFVVREPAVVCLLLREVVFRGQLPLFLFGSHLNRREGE